MKEQQLAFAVQGQSYGPMFDEKLTVAAWKVKPTWAVISTKDQLLPPAKEELAAKKMCPIIRSSFFGIDLDAPGLAIRP